MIDSRRISPHRLRPAGAAVAAVLLLATAGCKVSEPPSPEPQVAATATAAPAAQYRASVPLDGWDRYDPAEIEAGRLDAAWRSSAERDRQARSSGPWLTAGTAAAPAAAAPAPAVTAAPAGSTADTAPAGQAPVERLRTATAGPATPGGPAPTPAAQGAPPSGAPPAGGKAETWEAITPEAFTSLQPRFPVSDDGGPTVLAVQQLLDRIGFFPGVVDGRWGKNTEKALYWLQDSLGLEPTGSIDQALFDRLRTAAGTAGTVTTYRVTPEDVAGPFVTIPKERPEQAKLDCLCYGSAAEALAERYHTTRDLLAKLNPQVDLDHLAAGAELTVPDVEPLRVDSGAKADQSAQEPQAPSGIAALVVSKDGFYLQAVDAQGRVLYHFPTTVGAGYDASPSEDLKVTAIALRPTFHYQPKLFADVPDDEPTALLPAGPNSPVGVVWMQLSKENFGIHGTAEPATIGYSTSHGCVRLTNWDAQFLADRLPPGTPVKFRGEHPADAARMASEAAAAPSPTPAAEGR